MDILRKDFPAIVLEDQDCFSDEKQTAVLLELLSDKEAVSTLRKKWELEPERDSEDKWNDVKREAGKRQSSSKVVVLC